MAGTTFGERLKELRVAKGLTQQQLSDASGLSQNGISQWELGKREPDWSAVRALAKALGVSCEAFETDDQASEDSEPQGRGSPKKDTEAEEVEPEVKRPRGRPKKSGPK
jgi:transcriptional regulator with XRE-family HTH domain